MTELKNSQWLDVANSISQCFLLTKETGLTVDEFLSYTAGFLPKEAVDA